MNPPKENLPAIEHSRWFTENVQPHESSLRSFLHSSFPSVRDVDDVVQESFFRTWKASAIQPIRSAKAFLFVIARHVALDIVRRRRVSPIDPMPDLADLHALENGRDASESTCANEEILLLAEALDALPKRCREIIMLRKFQNFSQKDVATRLGISELTVQEQVYRGLRRCEKFLIKRGVIRPWRND